jgi:hypothetical protein
MRILLIGVFFLSLRTLPVRAQTGISSEQRSELEYQQRRDLLASQSEECRPPRTIARTPAECGLSLMIWQRAGAARGDTEQDA